MDRRNFLSATGAAAVAAGTAAAPALAVEVRRAKTAPVSRAGAKLLTLASEWAPEPAGFGPERLARRIETATDGRYRIEIAYGNADGDLTYGGAWRHAKLHPAFAFFAGLPFAQGLGASAQHTWLAVGSPASIFARSMAQTSPPEKVWPLRNRLYVT